MARDPIVEEVRRIRGALAKEYGYDVKAIVLALQGQEAESGRKLVPLPARRLPQEASERKAG